MLEKKIRNFIALPRNAVDVQGKVGLYLDSIIEGQLKHAANNQILALKPKMVQRSFPPKISFLIKSL